MNIKHKVIKSLPGLDAGSIVTIDCDENEIPIDRFWRRRIIDGDVIKATKSTSNSKTSKS